MNQNIIAAVESLLNSDVEVSPEQRKNILAACKSAPKKRRMGNRKEVLQILGVTAPTLLNYIRAGKVDVLKLSTRKCRFDLDQVEALANGGE